MGILIVFQIFYRTLSLTLICCKLAIVKKSRTFRGKKFQPMTLECLQWRVQGSEVQYIVLHCAVEESAALRDL